jgi:Fe-S cluster assembly scaffold protein SufB
MNKARVNAEPALDAQNVDAELIHEAAIGKIANDQLTKLMTLGLSRRQAESQIINGFLK